MEKLVCSDCPGSKTSGAVTLDIAPCREKKIVNADGQLGCPEETLETEGTEAAEEGKGSDTAKAEGDEALAETTEGGDQVKADL